VEIGGRVWLRALGLFPDPHSFAFFLGLNFCFVFGAIFYQKEKARLLFLVSIILIFALFLTFSRGGYLGLSAAMAFFVVLAWSKMKESGRKFLISVLALILVVVIFWGGATIFERFQSIFNFNEGSNLGRLQIWQDSFRVFRQYPLLGVGLGNYPAYFNFNGNYRSAISSHNTYLDILAETGFFGCAFWLLFFALVLRQVFKKVKIKKEDGNLTFVYLGAGGSIIYFLVHSFFETAIFNPLILAWIATLSGFMFSQIKND